MTQLLFYQFQRLIKTEMLLTKKQYKKDKNILWPMLMGPTLCSDNVVRMNSVSVILVELSGLVLGSSDS